MPKLGSMKCADCGADCNRLSPTQRYCGDCSQIRDIKRKARWAKANPATEAQICAAVSRHREAKSESRTAGAAVSKQSARSIAWQAGESIQSSWLIRIAVPFTYAASKNHIYAMGRKGHRFLRAESTAIRDEITLRIRSAIAGKEVVHNKVWLDILVQKSDHRGDAINVIDLVCDAVKKAIPVDDRWFSIRRLDWEIVKESPQLFIGVSQDSTENAQVCSYCGQILPWSAFCKSKHSKLGVGRECKECLKGGRKARTDAK